MTLKVKAEAVEATLIEQVQLLSSELNQEKEKVGALSHLLNKRSQEVYESAVIRVRQENQIAQLEQQLQEQKKD